MDREGAERFGAWLKLRRERLGITQTDLSRRGIIGRTVLSKLEAGKATIRTENALSLGRALGASDLETMAATGMLQGVTPRDVVLVEKTARLSERDQRVIETVIDALLKERETE